MEEDFLDNYIGECQHMYCENEATEKGFVLLRPENEGDAPNFRPTLMCGQHASSHNFFKTDTQEEIDAKRLARSEMS